MRTLQVISQDNNIPVQGLQKRIGLSNRPHLKIGMDLECYSLNEFCLGVATEGKGSRGPF